MPLEPSLTELGVAFKAGPVRTQSEVDCGPIPGIEVKVEIEVSQVKSSQSFPHSQTPNQ